MEELAWNRMVGGGEAENKKDVRFMSWIVVPPSSVISPTSK